MRACPRGVKVTSGLCLWPDSLGTAAATSRSSVGAGARPGQRAVAGHNISKMLGALPRSPDPQPRVFAKEAVSFIQQSGHSLKWLYFSQHFHFRNGLTPAAKT